MGQCQVTHSKSLFKYLALHTFSYLYPYSLLCMAVAWPRQGPARACALAMLVLMPATHLFNFMPSCASKGVDLDADSSLTCTKLSNSRILARHLPRVRLPRKLSHRPWPRPLARMPMGHIWVCVGVFLSEISDMPPRGTVNTQFDDLLPNECKFTLFCNQEIEYYSILLDREVPRGEHKMPA